MFDTSKNDIAAALALATQAIQKRNTIPILGNVLIQKNENGLILRATDMDMQVECDFAATIGKDFADFTCPANMLKDIVNKLPEAANLHFEQSKTGITLKAGRSVFRLQTLPVSDFPSLPDCQYAASFEIGAAALAAAIKGVAWAVSTEETRFYLNGFLLHPAPGKLIFVTTDGHRLAKQVLDFEDAPDFPWIIVPRGAIPTILKLLDKNKSVRISVSDSRIRFEADGQTVISKLVDGTFPPYERVIPTGNQTQMSVDTKQLATAVDRVSIVSSERGRAVKLVLTADQLELMVNNPDSGSADETLTVNYVDEPFEIAFNSKYLAEALAHILTETVTLLFSDAGGPAILRAENATDDLIVLMPMRF